MTSAFLQGEDLDRTVLVKPPTEAGMSGSLWRMRKAAYGLCDASRRWWIKVIEEMIRLGGITLVRDESLLYFHNNGKLKRLISMHVYDFKGAVSEWFRNNVMNKITELFKILRRESGSFKYTCINIVQNKDMEIYKSGRLQRNYYESRNSLQSR